MKTCCLCKTDKPMETFAKDKSRLDGLQPRCRKCQASLTSVWREKNRALLRQKSKEYHEKNIEKRHRAWRAYYRKNRKRVMARTTAWRKRNRMRVILSTREREAKRPGHATARMREWRQKNIERSRETIRRYRTRKKNAYIAPVDFGAIYERDHGLCGICGLPVDRRKATIDHIIPLARNGTHEPSNVQIAHGRCNSSKGTKMIKRSGPDHLHGS